MDCPCGCGWAADNCNNPDTTQGQRNREEVREILEPEAGARGEN